MKFKKDYNQTNQIDFEKLDIVGIAERLGVEIKHSTTNRIEVQGRCWACNDRKHHVYFNTSKNVFHCVRCSYSGNTYAMMLDFLGDKKEVFKFLKEDFHIDVNLYENRKRIEKINEKIKTIAPIEIRNAVYTEFLKYFPLNQKHYNSLKERGFGLEETRRNGYKSLAGDEKKRKKICADLMRKGYSLENIPGFYVDENGEWTFNYTPGFFVPVRDFYGRIQGMQIRVDEKIIKQKDIGKYIWFSSSNHETGTASGAFLHTAVPQNPVNKDTIYITEGPLKADIASKYLNVIFIAVPGVSLYKKVPEEVLKFKPKNAVVVFDADKKDNEAVKNTEENLVLLLKEAGLKTISLSWDIKIGKGIDDIVIKQEIKESLEAFVEQKLRAS